MCRFATCRLPLHACRQCSQYGFYGTPNHGLALVAHLRIFTEVDDSPALFGILPQALYFLWMICHALSRVSA